MVRDRVLAHPECRVSRTPIRNVPPRVGRAKALVAVRTRDHAPPEAIQAARAELAAANAHAAVRKMVDGWPPLTVETRAELAMILLGGGSNAAI
jgi:hypothetical protein